MLALLTGFVFLTMLLGALHVLTQPATSIAAAGFAAEFGALADAYRRLPAAQRETYLQDVADASQGRLVRDDPAQWGLDEPREPVARMVLGRLRAALPGEIIGHSEGAQHHFWLALPADNGGKHWLRVPAGIPRDDWIPASMLPLVGFALLAPVAAVYLGRRMRRRVSRVGLALDTVTLPDGASLPPWAPHGSTGAHGTDEGLQSRIDAMAGRLGQLQRDRACVLQDVATQLRRGLDALDAMASQPAAGAQALAADLQQVARQLTDFAAPEPQGALHPLALVAVAAQVAAAASAPGRHPAATVVLHLASLPVLQLRPMAVTRALAQVLDNALRHGGGAAEVHGRREGGWLVLEVLDRGEPLIDAELAMLGRPFFRSEAGRQRGLGAGLGLALVRRQLESHGGLVHVQRRPGGGLAVQIRLPVLPEGA